MVERCSLLMSRCEQNFCSAKKRRVKAVSNWQWQWPVYTNHTVVPCVQWTPCKASAPVSFFLTSTTTTKNQSATFKLRSRTALAIPAKFWWPASLNTKYVFVFLFTEFCDCTIIDISQFLLERQDSSISSSIPSFDC